MVNKPKPLTVLLSGNPNVGKSSVFNGLTGLNQHTGNWTGKTVGNAYGEYTYMGEKHTLVDIPGTYSLNTHSAEEEVARDIIVFGEYDSVIVVCDATCLERNLNLVLQILEITQNVVVCVNLIDEAKKKNIQIDIQGLSKLLKVPVVATTATKKKGLDKLIAQTHKNIDYKKDTIKIKYINSIESAINIVVKTLDELIVGLPIPLRYVAIKLLLNDTQIINKIEDTYSINLSDKKITKSVENAYILLNLDGITNSNLQEKIASCTIILAEGIANDVVKKESNYHKFDRKLDSILIGKWTSIPVMLLLLGLVFWITIIGANIPSSMLSDFFSMIEQKLVELCVSANVPYIVYDICIFGIYRVVTWVIAVMLPPMAIFFPLFTLLEDFGYLPRIAFNMDKSFCKCNACGKQSLTMCMGFGCNAVGVTGCRIIDSPRERLIAILTNAFVPCNGRFPTIIAILTMFFSTIVALQFQSIFTSLLLVLVILLSVYMTFLVSRLLSSTLLKGIPSSFTLELPPYRKPQISKILVRSVLDRTLFVLGRAVCVAIPAGLIIWIFANVYVGDSTILTICSQFLDPFAKSFGLDGVILLAFILGFPANEIVVPIIVMTYMAQGNLSEFGSLTELKELLLNNGWTLLTAINMIIFTLMHWPCSTTVLTIKKETKSLKWTVMSVLIPTFCGILLCYLTTFINWCIQFIW